MFAQESVMDIQKEKIAHEKHLLSQGVDFKYLPNIQYSELENVYELIEWDEEYSEALNEINSSWCTWQAAKAQAVPEGFVLVEKKEFEQMQEFEDLYRRAIFNSKKSIHEVNWSHVSNLGVGSTRAKAMCKRFNIDPEATFRKPQEPTND